jgi:glucosamine--fructose-6-phosphate aminotransferase (isomerizing)
MCGIVGMVGRRITSRALLSALQRLEFRGYDSFGVSVFHGSSFVTQKAVGAISSHAARVLFDSLPDALCAIGHTRWATHGAVTTTNAHPFASADGSFVVAHNGVIENHRELRTALAAKNIRCVSDTDSEVLVHLLWLNYRRTKNVLLALRETVARVTGEYAIVAATAHDPSRIYGVCHLSALACARMSDFSMLASDQRAISVFDSPVTFLEDGDFVEISQPRMSIKHRSTHRRMVTVARPAVSMPERAVDSELRGFSNHMSKEISETPNAIRQGVGADAAVIANVASLIRTKTTLLTGVGTPFYISQIGQSYLASIARRRTWAYPSDEIRSLIEFTPKDHLLALSQSGETFDTLEAIRAATLKHASTSTISNVFGSTALRISQNTLYQSAGPEICVVSTKSATSQAAVLYRLAVETARQSRALTARAAVTLLAEAESAATLLEQRLQELSEVARTCASRNYLTTNWFFIGRDLQFPVAMESALKLKELCYCHAEGMSAGFLKHGTISLIDENLLTVAFVGSRHGDIAAYNSSVASVAEVQARGGRVVVIAHDAKVTEDTGPVYDLIILPHTTRYLDVMVELVFGQLLAYHSAIYLNRNIDMPRSLAKSVTVR